MTSSSSSPEVLQWLKTLTVAPEYHPTVAEFQDPIAYIHKIEREASQYGICKIVPPVPPAPKKTAVANLNKSLAAIRSKDGDFPRGKSSPTFTTRQQQIGFCPRKPRPVLKPVWQSGERYTLQQFELKAKQFEKSQIRKRANPSSGSPISPLETETLFWKASAERPISVEYANDMPGSGFNSLSSVRKSRDIEAGSVGETSWNMRGVSRAKGSLLQFMKEDIPGVTSPMVYVAMMFSWFAWHVEDHDLHSLNYLHFGAGKTWYGVPRDARLAFEDAVRRHGYAGEVNALVTSAILGEKTTVMSPEVLIGEGIPCCRLVQNAGDFVVTFPGSYHCGFSLGFNCGEAANIATPEWLNVAKEAAIRRASMNYPPMVSHYQLLYELALSFISREPQSANSAPRSCRLKGKLKSESEKMIKEQFIQSVSENNSLIRDLLGTHSSCILLPRDISLARVKIKPKLLFSREEEAFDRDSGLQYLSHVCSMDGRFEIASHVLLDRGLLSCVNCGILSFSCAAIVQPTDASARFLMSADCITLADGDQADVEEKKRKKQESALDLLVSTYGEDSTDGEEEEISERNEILSYESQVSMRKCDMKASRAHIFCLEHALEVRQRLQSIGGSHLMIVCHPDYRNIVAEAKTLAEELGSKIPISTDIPFRDTTSDDEEKICAAIRDDESPLNNSDWTVKLGVNLLHASNLSKSPLYSQQLPYNPILYKIFSCNAQNSQKKTSRRNPVAGKWCGKVWTSNQVHPFLAKEEEEEEKDTRKKRQRSERKRKPTPKKAEEEEREDFPCSLEGCGKRLKTKPNQDVECGKKQLLSEKKRKAAPKKVEEGREEGEFTCSMEGCGMKFTTKQDMGLHRRNICPADGCGKKFFSHKYLVHHQRVHVDDRPLKCPWKGCMMSFKWAWARTEHIRVHTGDRPYVCKEAGCGQTFRFVSDFSRHKRKTGHVSKKKKKGSH